MELVNKVAIPCVRNIRLNCHFLNALFLLGTLRYIHNDNRFIVCVCVYIYIYI
jgi:hypothetical protein